MIYGRKSERVPKDNIQEISSHFSEDCVTREDFEWTNLDCKFVSMTTEATQ